MFPRPGGSGGAGSLGRLCPPLGASPNLCCSYVRRREAGGFGPALPVTACTRSGDWLSGFCSYTGGNSLCQINTILNFKITAGTPGITVIPIIVYPVCLLELARGVANICICVLHDSTAGERQELHVQRRAQTRLEVAVLRAAAKQEPWHCRSHSALGCPVSIPLPNTWPCPGEPGAALGPHPFPTLLHGELWDMATLTPSTGSEHMTQPGQSASSVLDWG